MVFIYFIGIDISKNKFDVAVNGDLSKNVKQFANDKQGIETFCLAYSDMLMESFVVLEATGGYETALLRSLVSKGVSVHRADPLQAKNFIRSLGKRAKTDALDALALARYAAERHLQLVTYKATDTHQDELKALMARRDDVIAMRKGELCRKKHPNYRLTHELVDNLIEVFDQQITAIEKRIRDLIAGSPKMSTIMKVLTNTKGVGEKTAFALLACLPELGQISRKQVASLAGCAPHPRDSGNMAGYRRTIGGRAIIKRSLYMASMSARKYNTELRPFYERLIQNGKKPMVALVALMRKIIVILNAKVRDEVYSKSW
jgi:transposase